jgi:hypothetical protein
MRELVYRVTGVHWSVGADLREPRERAHTALIDPQHMQRLLIAQLLLHRVDTGCRSLERGRAPTNAQHLQHGTVQLVSEKSALHTVRSECTVGAVAQCTVHTEPPPASAAAAPPPA